MCTPSSHKNGGPIIILISKIHDFCERREYAFNILLEYNIITAINIIERTQVHKFYQNKKK
jgi:hypothetical protein